MRERLAHGWQLCATPAGQYTSPDQLNGPQADAWLDIAEPMPAAAALRALGRWSLDAPPRRFDADDWWYRIDFIAPDAGSGASIWLGFDGLAGAAQAWLNGSLVLRSDNMYVATECEVSHVMRPGENTLVLRFASLDALLAQRRPRPRWRAPLVEHQQLRWFRSSLLGRTPGWSPPAAAVGPWKDVWLERRGALRLTDLQMRAELHGDDGHLSLAASFDLASCAAPDEVELVLERGDRVYRVRLQGDSGVYRGTLVIAQVEVWWPHTHGEPALYAAHLQLRQRDGLMRLPLQKIGFRHIELDTSDGAFSLRVNGVPVFCRGACWAPLDVVSLRATPNDTQAAVAQVRDAGMNMLRIPGTLVYEEKSFFEACDALGVLVWQDFMFANMDYPEHDAGFVASVETEVAQQLALWQGHACLAVVCGNSEVEQQAAMWGAPREVWEPALFHRLIADRVHAALPGVPYWPSSVHGGAFPHQANVGTTSYYGVGAYLRPLDDARRADLRFACECLAFANVPPAATVARMPGGAALRVHQPAWRERAPRDLGAGWDFEDVRDHYLAERYGVDPVKCRAADHERYLALSRAVTGELMAAAYAEWRRPGSRCGGALVLMLRDLWAGAGWGLLDDQGLPKQCFHALARALQPVSLSLTDEGGNGLVAHVVNERAQALHASLLVDLYAPGDVHLEQSQQRVELPARGATSLALAAGLDQFLDLSYAYRFGPPPVTLVHARLMGVEGVLLSEAHFLPAGAGPVPAGDIELSARVERDADGAGVLVLTAKRFAHAVHIEFDGCVPADDGFHLAPGATRRIALRSRHNQQAPLKGTVGALNADRLVYVREGP